MINGGRVILRDKKLADAADDYAWRADAELAHLDAAAVLTMSFARYLAEYQRVLRYKLATRLQLAIETLDHRHIGNCACYDIDERRGQAEMGIMIGDRDYWDRSYGTDALSTLVNYVFSTTELKRLYLKTLDSNVRAQRCFEKCHFIAHGYLARDGYRFILMELHRKDWQGFQPQDAAPTI